MDSGGICHVFLIAKIISLNADKEEMKERESISICFHSIIYNFLIFILIQNNLGICPLAEHLFYIHSSICSPYPIQEINPYQLFQRLFLLNTSSKSTKFLQITIQ